MWFILCPDCSEDLGSVMELVLLARHGLIKKNISESPELKEFSPRKIALSPNIIPPIGEILDAVGLTLDCCRSHMLGYADFQMNYKSSVRD